MNATIDKEPVEILDRKTLPGDCTSHARMRFGQLNNEQQTQFRKSFPDPMPATHRLAYSWTVENGQPVLYVGPEPIPAEATVVTSSMGDIVGIAGDVEIIPAPPVVDTAERDRLMALSMPDLKDLAAQRGVPVKPKGQSQAQLVSEVLKAAPK
jgi:hypothetical protein